MKQLLRKEWREQFKIALLGFAIFTLLIVMTVRNGMLKNHGLQPLLFDFLLEEAAFFCAIFGVALGWLQMQAEKHADLRAFLLHRPVPPTTLLLGKLLAGIRLYCLGVGLPMAGLLVYVLIPGHVAAPFEWAMVLPLSNIFLLGLVFYGAGLLAGLRQARWFGSRCFGIGLAILAAVALLVSRDYWQALLFIVISALLLHLAVWGTFKTGGFYQHQPWPGKIALSITCAASGLILCGLMGAGLDWFFSSPDHSYRYSYYQVTKDGGIYKITQGDSGKPAIVNLQGQPLLNEKTGHPAELSDFYKRLPVSLSAVVNFTNPRDLENGVKAGYTDINSYFTLWSSDDKTLWYITRAGQLVVYDALTRRKLRTVEPVPGSALEASTPVRFHRSRFNFAPFQSGQPWYLASDQTLYRVDLENQTVAPVFSTTNSAGIGGFSEQTLDHEVLIVTRDRIQLLAADGHAELSIPFQPAFPDYDRISVFRLQATNQFVVRFDPNRAGKDPHGGTLLAQIKWVTDQGDILRNQMLPSLPQPSYNDSVGQACTLVFPATLRLAGEYSSESGHRWDRWDRLSLIPVPIFVLAGWIMGRRYRFTLAEQLSWALFHALLGIPGLLAFFSVQEWPAKEPCPQCQKPRMVDREHCEHCDAKFSPPKPNGTEIFAPAAVPPASALVEK